MRTHGSGGRARARAIAAASAAHTRTLLIFPAPAQAGPLMRSFGWQDEMRAAARALALALESGDAPAAAAALGAAAAADARALRGGGARGGAAVDVAHRLLTALAAARGDPLSPPGLAGALHDAAARWATGARPATPYPPSGPARQPACAHPGRRRIALAAGRRASWPASGRAEQRRLRAGRRPDPDRRPGSLGASGAARRAQAPWRGGRRPARVARALRGSGRSWRCACMRCAASRAARPSARPRRPARRAPRAAPPPLWRPTWPALMGKLLSCQAQLHRACCSMPGWPATARPDVSWARAGAHLRPTRDRLGLDLGVQCIPQPVTPAAAPAAQRAGSCAARACGSRRSHAPEPASAAQAPAPHAPGDPPDGCEAALVAAARRGRLAQALSALAHRPGQPRSAQGGGHAKLACPLSGSERPACLLTAAALLRLWRSEGLWRG